MIQIIKSHKWAILVALIAAIIIAYPQVYLRYDLGDSYRGIDLMGASDDEISRSVRAREAYDGHLLLGNPFFKDGKDDPYLHQPLGSIMAAYLGRIFFLNFNDAILFSRFLFSFVAFLVIYGFLASFLQNKLTALAVSSVFLLAQSLFTRQAIFDLMGGQSPRTNFLELTRPVDPALTWLFFFGFLWFFWMFLDKNQWKWGVVSIILLGAAFYNYFFTWSFIYAFCGVLVLIFFFQKKWQEIKRIAIILLSALLLAIPYLINLYKATAYPNYAEVGKRLGLLESSEPAIGLLVPALFVIFLLFFPRKWRERYFFGLALVITPFVVLNQQLITGKILGPAHYHWYMHKPLAIIFVLFILFYWLSRTKLQFLTKHLAVFLIVSSLFYGVFIQNSSYERNRGKIVERQRYGQLIDWFNENAKKDEAVFSDRATMILTAIHTPLNVFYFPSARYTLAATQERLVDILFTYYRLDGVNKENADEIFLKDKREVSALLYGMEYRELAGDYSDAPDEIILGHSRGYKESLGVRTDDFLKDSWAKYQMDYFVWDKKQSPRWQLSQYSFLKEIAEVGDFIIYKKI